MNYEKALYRRNSSGEPYVWYCEKLSDNSIHIEHGIVGKNLHNDFYRTDRNSDDEINSRIKAKIKSGYLSISEIRDDNTLPVEKGILYLYRWLDTYLPRNRSTGSGILLPMLAKAFDDKVFERCSSYLGQWKINGLRCFAKPYRKSNDLFHPVGFEFQSREGTVWNSLSFLEEYLLENISNELIEKMIDNNAAFDGELYIPNYPVNQINHFVKDANCVENRHIQYWVYDIAIDHTPQWKRLGFLCSRFDKFVHYFDSKNEHYNNTDRLVILPFREIINSKNAYENRNRFIDCGFEGLILRNPDAEYEYGKRRVGVMVKFKQSTDGMFEVINIYPEGIKRNDIPLLLCKNDINENTFEVHLSEPFEVQRKVLANKDKYIGSTVSITFGERSGVTKVPFHVKNVHFI